MSDADIIKGMVGGVTKKWTKQRKAEERTASAAIRRVSMFSSRYTVKDAAWEIMEEAYMKASAGGTLPAHARQVMYAARGYIQDQTGKPLGDQYFIQNLLVNYMQEHGLEGVWNVVFDARGHLIEPHTKTNIPLGTLEVRDYLHDASHAASKFNDLGIDVNDDRIDTKGPERRYGAILFIEKEGFMPLFKEVKLANRYDIAIMSTKGMSVTAARELVDDLCGSHDIPLLILRDFDKAGFSIASTIANDTDRYMYTNAIEVHDLGLRLNDVEEYKLSSESVCYGKTNPEHNLYRNGATGDEVSFLSHGYIAGRGYMGSRVELNAFTSDQLIKWIESKLEERGITKVIPDQDALVDAWRRALILNDVREAIEEATKKAEEEHEDYTPPDQLPDRVNNYLKKNPESSWDDAIMALVEGEAA